MQPPEQPTLRSALRFVVPDEADGLPLDRVLRSELRISRKLWRRLRRAGVVTLNGRAIPLDHPLPAGGEVELLLPEGAEGGVTPEPIPLRILFEDEHLLVLDKPAGLLVHPSGPVRHGTLINGVAYYLQAKGEWHRAGPVTRLDRLTSGLVLFAKHPHAHHRCARALAQGTLRRDYLAVVVGWPVDDAGRIDAPIARAPGELTRRVIAPPGEGQAAVTEYRVLARFSAPPPLGTASLLALTLRTGRTHQIRLHMAHLGHPVAGDPLYGESLPGLCERQALHAWRLTLPHPITGRLHTWVSPLPDDLRRLLPPALHDCDRMFIQ